MVDPRVELFASFFPEPADRAGRKLLFLSRAEDQSLSSLGACVVIKKKKGQKERKGVAGGEREKGRGEKKRKQRRRRRKREM